MKSVYVWTALWNIDTKIDNRGRVRNENQLRSYTPTDRYNLLGRVVEEAWVAMAKDLFARADTLGGASFLFLFVAPEYYFSVSDTAHAMTQAEKDKIVGYLKALSSEYPSLVLVPGTIAWKKPLNRTEAQKYKKGTAIEKNESRMQKFMKRIDAAANTEIELAPNAASRMIAERIRLAEGDHESIARFSSAGYRQTITQQLVDAAKDKQKATKTKMITNVMANADRCYVARNTAYGFHEGKEVARYHKRGDYFEVLHTESDDGYVIYEPGGGPEGAGDRFHVENVWFGVEVCLDHQMGFLSQTGGVRPDVHIIMSADIEFIKEHAFVPKGGYVVHASSNAACTTVYHNDDGVIKEVKTTEADTTVGKLHYATLTFEVAETIEDMIALTQQRSS